MKARLYFFALLFWVVTLQAQAQGFLRSDYLLSSTLKNKEGDKFGSGDLLKVSGRYTLPFSVKKNSSGQVSAWSATLSGSYGKFTNKDLTTDIIIPDNIINLGLAISHIRPISGKWYLMASLGGGVYSEPDAITAKSILVNGGVFLVYKLLDRLDIGLGAGVTTSYGTPMVMPMSYVKWELTGKYEIKAEVANNMRISASAKLTDKFKLNLVAIEMDGMSAVMDVDGKSMIYSSTIMKSYLSPELKIGKSSTLYMGVGGAWLRASKVSERNLTYFWETFKKDNESLGFSPTGYLAVGFKYGF